MKQEYTSFSLKWLEKKRCQTLQEKMGSFGWWAKEQEQQVEKGFGYVKKFADIKENKYPTRRINNESLASTILFPAKVQITN